MIDKILQSVQDKRDRRKERRLVRKARANAGFIPKIPPASAIPRIVPPPETYFKYEISHGQPKIFCKICSKAFTWNDEGRSLGISVSFAVRHLTEKHGLPAILPSDLKSWIMKRSRK
jgi:hypothetical protein